MRDIKSLKTEIQRQVTLPLERVSVVKLVDLLVEFAYIARASDIHIHPEEDGVRVRYRIDGLLRDLSDKERIDRTLHQEIISRIKVMSGLRTDEHMAPQDGRFRVNLPEVGDVDVRVSILPTYYGENAVMRVLAESHTYDLKSLGFSDADLGRVEYAIKKPYGMILANGPTGSGKTTTLYTILKQLNDPVTSIITIEDPIEYSLSGTTQIQVNAATGLTFGAGLRSILRQDPNIVMVGEIRDEETAGIAVNAALTGHLVLSTLHTNDSATTFPRLMDMGVPSFLVASTVNVAMGQRLVRKLCEKCKKVRKLSNAEVKSLSEVIPDEEVVGKTFYRGDGCPNCGNTGYLGRLGIREVLEINSEVRALIMQRASAQEIKDAAVRNGMTTMLVDGVRKAAGGLTTIEEVLRIIHE
jgi:type II secretory ATPase GspE/PulE/Tfp pilus assembly ATPase PilB-like protein